MSRALVLRRHILTLAVALAAVFGALLLRGVVAQAASPPSIEGESAYNVTLDAAVVQAQLNPEGSETTYRFEYGTSVAYGSSAPAGDGQAGSGASATSVETPLRGLAADTLYHYRLVASNAAGVVDGSDHTFATFAPVSDVLPDGRHYELVSPPDKNGGEIDEGAVPGDVLTPEQASADGSSMMFESSTSFEGAPGEAVASILDSSYISTRGAGGWSTRNVTPPTASVTHVNPLSVEASSIEGMSADLSTGFFVSNSTSLAGAFPGFIMPYRFEVGKAAEALSAMSPPGHEPGNHLGDFDPVFAGASSDFSHIALRANDRLTPDALGTGRNLYEWSGGQLRLVNVLPDGSALPSSQIPVFGGAEGSSGGGENFNRDFAHIVSADGSRIFWTDTADKELFARVDGTSTVWLSQPQKTNGTGPGGTDPSGPALPIYQGASSDGSKVFFTSAEELTNDANTGGGAGCEDCGEDLYEYDFDKPVGERLTDLTADAGDALGAQIQGVLGSSEDGSYVYFVTSGALTAGADTGNCIQGQGDETCNLYVWHEGSGSRLVARVEWPSSTGSIAAVAPQQRTSRVSPNGRFLAFQSERPLTGYDNAVAGRAACAGQLYEDFTAPCPEVFRYDAVANQLVCASCNPTGGRPLGPSIVPPGLGRFLGSDGVQRTGVGGPGWTTAVYQQRYLSDDGRLFFDTEDALSPRDTNGQADVYEYQDGEAHLISGGFGSDPSMFIDASTSGEDVFFATRDQLAATDQDGAIDVYDARVGASALTTAPPPCASSDACKPGPAPQPSIFGAPASATFSGAGNVASPPSTARKIVAKKQKPRSLTKRAQALARALRACKGKPKITRQRCEAQAHRSYGSKPKAKSNKPKGRSNGRGK